MPAKNAVFFSETQDFSITFGKICFLWILTNTLFFIKTKAMAKAISMPNPLFAWSYWFLLWDQRLFLGLRLSWQKIYLMQKKVCYMSQVLRFDNVFLRPIFGFHRTSNCPFYSLETSCKALTKYERPKMKRYVRQKFRLFLRKRLHFSWINNRWY